MPILGFLAAIMIAFGAIFFRAQFLPNGNRMATLEEHIFLSVFGSGLIGCGGYMLLILLRHVIIADDDGLRWRGMLHGWRTARWSEITDYYETPVLTNGSSNPNSTPVIQVANRSLVLSNLNPAALYELKELVRVRATSARAKEWGRLGTRQIDPFPRTFRYYHPEQWHTVAVPIGISLFFCALIVGYGIVLVWSTMARAEWRELVPAVTGAVLLMGAALLYIPCRIIASRWEAYQRRGESFTVTPETLCYDNVATGEHLDVSWNDVSDYFYQERSGGLSVRRFSLTLRGTDEKQITWIHLLREANLFLSIVQQFAPKPANAPNDVQTWRNRSPHEATNNSDPATWQGGAVGMGGRIFRQRCRTNALGLSGCTVGALIVVGVCIAEWIAPGKLDERGFSLGTTLFCMLSLIWAWICFLCTRVETDNMGITHYTPFGKTYLSWFAVADYWDHRSASSKSSEPTIVVGRDGKRMVFWTMLNGYNELRDEIVRYAPPPKTGWKKAKNTENR